MCRRHFRELCGVEEGQPWPDPSEVRLQEGTGERFYTPDFRLGVGAKINQQLFERAASLVMEDVVSVANLKLSRRLSSCSAPGALHRHSTRGLG
jgi:hypothetical protein